MDIPKIMRAVTLRGKGWENLSVTTIPVPDPNDNQLLARVDCAGICTSLLKIIAQGPSHPMMYGWNLKDYPAILGDEGSITLVRIGKNLKEKFHEGERYVLQPSVNHSPTFRKYFYPNNGEGIYKVGAGYTLPGHLAEYILITEDEIDADCLIKIPNLSIPFAHAAIAEPLSCCISAQEHHLHLLSDDLKSRREIKRGVLNDGILVIIGAGMMGRMNLDIAISSMPSVIIVSDFIKERLEIVEGLFRERTERLNINLVLSDPDKLEQLIQEYSSGKGADDVIVAVGNKKAVEDAQFLVGRGGVLDIFGGLARNDDQINLSTGRVHYDEISIVGSSGGIPWDIKRAIELISDQKIEPSAHIMRVCNLEDVPEVLNLMQDKKLDGKAIVYPHIKLDHQIDKRTWTKKDEESLLFNYNN